MRGTGRRHVELNATVKEVKARFEMTPERPLLLTSAEVAELLRTSRSAIYAMIARGQLPGVTRIGRRVLYRRDVLLDWLDQKRTPSLEE